MLPLSLVQGSMPGTLQTKGRREKNPKKLLSTSLLSRRFVDQIPTWVVKKKKKISSQELSLKQFAARKLRPVKKDLYAKL